MAHRSPFFQAQSRSGHSRSESVTLAFLSLYDSGEEDLVESSSAPTTPAAGPSSAAGPSTMHRRTSSAIPSSASCKSKQHRRNSAISKKSLSLPVPQPTRAQTPSSTSSGPAASHFIEFSPPPVLTLSPPPEAGKRPRRQRPRLHVTNGSTRSSTRHRTPASSFVEPESPPPPYSLHPSQSTRRVSVPTAGAIPTLPSSPHPRDAYTSSPYLRDAYTSSPLASTFLINRTGDISPQLRMRQGRPLPPSPSPPRLPEPEESELDDPDRRPSLPVSESGLSATSATTLTETESIHPFDSDEEEEEAEDVVDIGSPSRDEQFDHLQSFLEFSSCSSSLSSEATTGPLRLPRKFRPTSVPIVGTFDPAGPEYSGARGALSAGLMKQCKRIVATGKTKLVSVGRKRSDSTDSIGSATSSESKVDWADALEGTLFG